MNELTLFDYGQLDIESRIVVKQRTEEIKTLVRRSAQDIIDIGNKLIDVKERLGHGGFGDWLEREFGWSEGTARRFINVALNMRQIDHGDRFEMKALYLLAAPSTPEPARIEAIERAQAGEEITYTAAKTIVAQHRTPEPSPSQHTFDSAPPSDLEPPLMPPDPPAPSTDREHEWSPSEIDRKNLAEQGRTVHANMKTDLSLIEWAKKQGIFARVDRATEWGNPFHLPDDGDRATVLENYRWYLQRKPSLLAKLHLLKGRVLGCWCHPEPCHAGILEEYANDN